MTQHGRLVCVDPPGVVDPVEFQWMPQSTRKNGQAQVDSVDREQHKAMSVFAGTSLHTMQLSGVVWDVRRSGAPGDDLEPVRQRLHKLTQPVGGAHQHAQGPPVVAFQPWGEGLDWTVTVDWRDTLRLADGRLVRLAVNIALQEWWPAAGKETPAQKASRVKDKGGSSQSEPGDETHTVEPGETLSSIAADFYGDAGKWQAIFDANELRSGDPDLIYPGEKLTIPRGQQ